VACKRDASCKFGQNLDICQNTAIFLVNMYFCNKHLQMFSVRIRRRFVADSPRIHRRFTADIFSTADSPQIHRRYFFNRGFTADSPQIFQIESIMRISVADSPQIHRRYFFDRGFTADIFKAQIRSIYLKCNLSRTFMMQIHRGFTADIFSTADSPQIHRRYSHREFNSGTCCYFICD
jgi:hypothetical protein